MKNPIDYFKDSFKSVNPFDFLNCGFNDKPLAVR